MVSFYQNTSLGYLFVILIFSGIYWIISKRYRRYFLLVLSTSFIILFSPLHALILFALLVISYLFAKYFTQTKNKILLYLIIIILLLNLGFFKYSNYLLGYLKISGNVTTLLIPFLGISYFTFRMIHFVVDVYNKKIINLNFTNYVHYVIFFPTYSSGPIERYGNFNNQIVKFNFVNFTKGFERILIGLFKKLAIADTLAIFTKDLTTYNEISISKIWIYVYFLSIQIYADFSGYSDIAIGIAQLFGYKIMENFNWPYLKQDLSVFWKNWHISLTSWIRDYIFIPLGGSRVKFWHTCANTMIIMLVVGIWHGPSLNFIIWGAIHGIALIFLRLYRMIFPLKQNKLTLFRKIFGIFITFNFVTFTWIFFFYDIGTALKILQKMFF